MTIPAETVEQIRLATGIVELVREYIPTLKRSGRNWKANCPFHHEKTPSFMVNGEKGIFHCFGCHAGGDVFKFVMLIDSLTWPEAVRKLAARVGVTIVESREEIVNRSEKQKIYDLLEQAATFYHRALLEAASGGRARDYLQQRGVTPESIEKFHLGYAPQGQLLSGASKSGFSPEQLIAAGLMTRTERGRLFEYMSGRLTFPIVDTQGRVVAFGGRTLTDDQPKYLNTPETKVYSKSQQLYGLHQAIPTLRQSKEVAILEGYMDVVVTHQCGVTNTVATLGTALTQQQSQVLHRYADRIMLLFDPDAAGNNAARRAIETLIDSEIEVRIANLPEGLDPDEFLLREGKEKFDAWLKKENKSVIEFLTMQAMAEFGSDTPEAKMKVAASVLPTVAKAKNAILRHEWLKHLSEQLHITEDAMLDEWRRLTKTTTAKSHQSAQERETKHTVIRTAEEEVLQLIVAYPHCRSMVKETHFANERNRQLFALLIQNVPVSDIINRLNESDVSWFSELILEEKSYTAPEQVLDTLLKEMRQRELEQKRQRLEKEVVMMLEGRIPPDNEKMQLYQDLTRQLKGSVKS